MSEESLESGAQVPKRTDAEEGAETALADRPVPQTRAAVLEVSEPFDAESIQRAVARLHKAGWNTLVLPALLDGYPLFPSQVWADYGLRRQHPAFRGSNPLEAIFDAAWPRGMAVMLSHTPYLIG